MKIPRDIGGDELAKLVARYGYKITRITGSHMRLETQMGGEHHITIVKKKPLKVGTVDGVIRDIAKHFGRSKQELIKELFG